MHQGTQYTHFKKSETIAKLGYQANAREGNVVKKNAREGDVVRKDKLIRVACKHKIASLHAYLVHMNILREDRIHSGRKGCQPTACRRLIVEHRHHYRALGWVIGKRTQRG